jgi:aspartate/glutamate racemase
MEKTVREVDREIEILHILDEPLLFDLLHVGYITPDIQWRFTQLVVEGARVSPRLILVTGSSFGPCVDVAQAMVSVPVIKVDERMATEAVAYGTELLVVATEQTTVAPTRMLLERKAKVLGKEVRVHTLLCEGAHSLLRANQADEHDRIVLDQIRRQELAGIDAIVLAQVSTGRVQEQVTTLTGKKVFSSPSMVSNALKECLFYAKPKTV